jgi:hypothetical protein
MHAGRFESFSSGRRDSTVLRGPRVIRDGDGGDVITVVERRADGVAGARGPSCLLFSTDRGFTRLWNYPENWIDMSDAELKQLSEFRRSQSA